MRRSERVSFIGGSGHELAGIIDFPEDGLRAAAVFSHCFTCNKDLKAIVRISRGLAERGFAVLRYDMTGLGNSQGDFSQSNFTTNQQDLRAAFDFLESRIDAPKFLVGHSFGAACSLSLTQEIQDVVGTVSIAGPSDTQHLADLLNRMNSEIEVRGIGTVTIGGFEYVIRKQMLDDFRSHDLPARVRAIDKPVLLFHSHDDETLAYEHVLRLFDGLSKRPGTAKPAEASLVNIPGADHLLIRNPADVEFVVSTIAAWMDRQSQRLSVVSAKEFN